MDKQNIHSNSRLAQLLPGYLTAPSASSSAAAIQGAPTSPVLTTSSTNTAGEVVTAQLESGPVTKSQDRIVWSGHVLNPAAATQQPQLPPHTVVSTTFETPALEARQIQESLVQVMQRVSSSLADPSATMRLHFRKSTYQPTQLHETVRVNDATVVAPAVNSISQATQDLSTDAVVAAPAIGSILNTHSSMVTQDGVSVDTFSEGTTQRRASLRRTTLDGTVAATAAAVTSKTENDDDDVDEEVLDAFRESKRIEKRLGNATESVRRDSLSASVLAEPAHDVSDAVRRIAVELQSSSLSTTLTSSALRRQSGTASSSLTSLDSPSFEASDLPAKQLNTAPQATSETDQMLLKTDPEISFETTKRVLEQFIENSNPKDIDEALAKLLVGVRRQQIDQENKADLDEPHGVLPPLPPAKANDEMDLVPKPSEVSPREAESSVSPASSILNPPPPTWQTSAHAAPQPGQPPAPSLVEALLTTPMKLSSAVAVNRLALITQTAPVPSRVKPTTVDWVGSHSPPTSEHPQGISDIPPIPRPTRKYTDGYTVSINNSKASKQDLDEGSDEGNRGDTRKVSSGPISDTFKATSDSEARKADVSALPIRASASADTSDMSMHQLHWVTDDIANPCGQLEEAIPFTTTSATTSQPELLSPMQLNSPTSTSNETDEARWATLARVQTRLYARQISELEKKLDEAQQRLREESRRRSDAQAVIQEVASSLETQLAGASDEETTADLNATQAAASAAAAWLALRTNELRDNLETVRSGLKHARSILKQKLLLSPSKLRRDSVSVSDEAVIADSSESLENDAIPEIANLLSSLQRSLKSIDSKLSSQQGAAALNTMLAPFLDAVTTVSSRKSCAAAAIALWIRQRLRQSLQKSFTKWRDRVRGLTAREERVDRGLARMVAFFERREQQEERKFEAFAIKLLRKWRAIAMAAEELERYSIVERSLQEHVTSIQLSRIALFVERRRHQLQARYFLRWRTLAAKNQLARDLSQRAASIAQRAVDRSSAALLAGARRQALRCAFILWRGWRRRQAERRAVALQIIQSNERLSLLREGYVAERIAQRRVRSLCSAFALWRIYTARSKLAKLQDFCVKETETLHAKLRRENAVRRLATILRRSLLSRGWATWQRFVRDSQRKDMMRELEHKTLVLSTAQEEHIEALNLKALRTQQNLMANAFLMRKSLQLLTRSWNSWRGQFLEKRTKESEHLLRRIRGIFVLENVMNRRNERMISRSLLRWRLYAMASLIQGEHGELAAVGPALKGPVGACLGKLVSSLYKVERNVRPGAAESEENLAILNRVVKELNLTPGDDSLATRLLKHQIETQLQRAKLLSPMSSTGLYSVAHGVVRNTFGFYMASILRTCRDTIRLRALERVLATRQSKLLREAFISRWKAYVRKSKEIETRNQLRDRAAHVMFETRRVEPLRRAFSAWRNWVRASVAHRSSKTELYLQRALGYAQAKLRRTIQLRQLQESFQAWRGLVSIRSCRSLVEAHEDARRTLEEQLQMLTVRLQQEQQLSEDLRLTLESQVKANEENVSTLADIRAQLTEARTERDTCTQQLAEERRNLQELQAKLTAEADQALKTSEEVMQLKMQVESEKQRAIELRAQLESEIAARVEAVSTAGAVSSQLRTLEQHLAEAKLKYEADMTLQRNENATLSSQLKDAEDLISSLHREMKVTKEELESQKATETELRESVANLSTELALSTSTIQGLRDELQVAREAEQGWKTQAEALTRYLQQDETSRKAEIDLLQQRIADLLQDAGRRDEALKATLERAQRAETALVEAREQSAADATLLQELRQARKEAEDQRVAAEIRCTEALQELSVAQATLEDARKDWAEVARAWHAEESQYRASIEELKRQLNDSHVELQAAKTEKGKLIDELESVSKLNLTYHQELSDSKKALEGAQQELVQIQKTLELTQTQASESKVANEVYHAKIVELERALKDRDDAIHQMELQLLHHIEKTKSQDEALQASHTALAEAKHMLGEVEKARGRLEEELSEVRRRSAALESRLVTLLDVIEIEASNKARAEEAELELEKRKLALREQELLFAASQMSALSPPAKSSKGISRRGKDTAHASGDESTSDQTGEGSEEEEIEDSGTRRSTWKSSRKRNGSLHRKVIDELNSALEQLRASAATSSSTAQATMDQALAQETNRRLELESQEKQLREECRQLMERVKTLTQENEQLQSERNRLSHRLSSVLEELPREYETQIRSLQSELEASQSQLARSTARIAQLKRLALETNVNELFSAPVSSSLGGVRRPDFEISSSLRDLSQSHRVKDGRLHVQDLADQPDQAKLNIARAHRLIGEHVASLKAAVETAASKASALVVTMSSHSDREVTGATSGAVLGEDSQDALFLQADVPVSDTLSAVTQKKHLDNSSVFAFAESLHQIRSLLAQLSQIHMTLGNALNELIEGSETHANLNESLQAKTSENARLAEQLQTLTEKLSQSREQMNILLEDMTRKLQLAEQQLAQRAAEVEALRQDNEDTKQRLSQLQQTASAKEGEASSLRNVLMERETVLQNTQMQLSLSTAKQEDLKRALESLQRHCEELKAKLDAVDAELQTKRDQVSTMNAQASRSEERLEWLETLLQQSRQERDNYQKKLEAAEAELVRLREEAVRNQHDILRLKDALSSASKHEPPTHASIAQASHPPHDTLTSIAEATLKRQEEFYQQIFQQLRSDQTTHHETARQALKDLELKERSAAEFAEHNRELRQQIKQLEQRIQAFEDAASQAAALPPAQNQSRSNARGQVAEDISQLENQIASLQMALIEEKTKSMQANATIAQYSQSIRQLESETQDLRSYAAEIRQLRAERAAIETRLAEAESETTELRKKLAAAQERNLDVEKSNAELNASIQYLTNLLRDAKSQLTTLEKEKTQLETTVSKLEQSLRDRSQHFTDCEKEFESSINELSVLNDQLKRSLTQSEQRCQALERKLAEMEAQQVELQRENDRGAARLRLVEENEADVRLNETNLREKCHALEIEAAGLRLKLAAEQANLSQERANAETLQRSLREQLEASESRCRTLEEECRALQERLSMQIREQKDIEEKARSNEAALNQVIQAKQAELALLRQRLAEEEGRRADAEAAREGERASFVEEVSAMRELAESLAKEEISKLQLAWVSERTQLYKAVGNLRAVLHEREELVRALALRAPKREIQELLARLEIEQLDARRQAEGLPYLPDRSASSADLVETNPALLDIPQPLERPAIQNSSNVLTTPIRSGHGMRMYPQSIQPATRHAPQLHTNENAASSTTLRGSVTQPTERVRARWQTAITDSSDLDTGLVDSLEAVVSAYSSNRDLLQSLNQTPQSDE